MLILDDMFFHNVAELGYDASLNAQQLIRVPRELIAKLHKSPANAREKYKNPNGCEMRFVMLEDCVSIKLFTSDVGCTVSIFHGDFVESNIVLQKGENELTICRPMRLACLDTDKRITRFTTNVVRLVFHVTGRKDIFYVSKQGETRLPTADELPEKTLMAYGTSITQGTDASYQPLTYIAQVARSFDMDLINLGIGGGAFCEPEIVDFVSDYCDWDMAVVCVSVNMITKSVELSDYYNRVLNLLKTISVAHPEKHIFCISPFTYYGDYEVFPKTGLPQFCPEDYREKVEAAVCETGSPYLHYIHGRELLSDMSGLSADFLHPSDMGMIEIAGKLIRFIKSTLN